MLHTDTIRIAAPYRDILRALELDTVERVLSRITGDVVAWSRTTDTLRVARGAELPGYFLKRYRFPRWSNRLRGMLRGTFFGMNRAQAEFLALREMQQCGLPAVRPVAHGQRRIGHFLTAAFLITEEAPHTRNLTSVALDPEHGLATLARSERNLLVTALAEAVAALHAEGYSHGNLFWRNILVRVGVDGRPEFFFVDPQPLPRWRRLPSNWYLHELAQLAVSAEPFLTRSEWVRLILTYYNARRLNREIKSAIREIERLLPPARPHERRRIRMTALFDEWLRQLDGGRGVRPLRLGVGRL